MDDIEYAGFWIRMGAALIDTLIILIITLPLLSLYYGQAFWSSDKFVVGWFDFILNYILIPIVVIIFWIYKTATPGKMALNLSIVDAKTGKGLSTGQAIGRYLGYYVAMIPLMLGIIWVGIDKRKQGWHDKLAGTVVIRNNKLEPVRFQ